MSRHTTSATSSLSPPNTLITYFIWKILDLPAVRRRGSRFRGKLDPYLDYSSRDGLGGMGAQIRCTDWVYLATFAMAKVMVTYSDFCKIQSGPWGWLSKAENVAITWM